MNVVRMRFHIAAGAVLLSLITFSFVLACRLTSDGSFRANMAPSLLSRFLGESRRAVGANICEQADRYFHRGVGHRVKEAPMGFIQRMAEEIQPRIPEHLSGGEINEMMPWLRFATRIDPHNVDAYLGAAFWVAQQTEGQQQQALAILAEARNSNPSDYRIPLQRGLILLHEGELDNAAQAFDLALELFPRTKGIDPEQKRLDRAGLLNFRGFLYELAGRTDKALSCYQEHLRIKPEANGIRDTIRLIENGQRSRADAERVLKGLIAKRITPDEACHHDEGHEHETHEMHLPPLELHLQ